jgi:prevent-host-death family protein
MSWAQLWPADIGEPPTRRAPHGNAAVAGHGAQTESLWPAYMATRRPGSPGNPDWFDRDEVAFSHFLAGNLSAAKCRLNLAIMVIFTVWEAGMGRVGVAELKASLSQYLARVQAGETVIVTDHGRPVARLVPVAGGKQEPEERLRSLERLGLVRRGSG